MAWALLAGVENFCSHFFLEYIYWRRSKFISFIINHLMLLLTLLMWILADYEKIIIAQ